jgi:hypothetical protein
LQTIRIKAQRRMPCRPLLLLAKFGTKALGRPKPLPRAYHSVMKTRYFAACALALASLVLSGCATQTTTATTTATETDQTLKRVHTQEELKKTGEPETAAALEKVDPSVRVSGRR